MCVAPTRSAVLYHKFCGFNNQVCSPAGYFVRGNNQQRLWDVENKRKQKSVIVVKSKERGARTKITTCAYSPDGKLISAGTSPFHSSPPLFTLYAACLDGCLHMWNASSNFVRPNMTVEAAHARGTDVGSVVFSVDGRTVLTRGGDETVKRASPFRC